MGIATMIGVAFIMMCAPGVDPSTVQDIIRLGEAGGPFAININQGERVAPRDVAEAIALTKSAIASGKSVDIGYMQVNNRTGAAMGYTVEDLFDPCLNLRAGSDVLSGFYTKAVATYGEGQVALRAALSAYNTGDFQRGFANGYVAKYFDGPVMASPARVVPAYAGPNPYAARTSVPLPQEQHDEHDSNSKDAGDGGFRHDGTADAGSGDRNGPKRGDAVGSL